MRWIFRRGSPEGDDFSEIKAKTRELEARLAASEEGFNQLVLAFPEPVWILDAELRPLRWNPALVQLSRKGAVVSSELSALSVHAWFREPEVHATLVLALKAPCRSEFESDGRVYELSCSPFFRGGEVAGVIAVFHEVTLLKRAEQARVDLVVNVSHELRTPLTAIKGFTDTLQADLEQGRTGQALDYVAVIQRNADRLLALIQDLLLLSKIESGVDALSLELVSTRELTERAIEGLRPLKEKLGHRIETEFKAEVVRGDSLRIEQVLVNLVENALRYAPAVSGPVRVSWKNDRDSVVLEVTDSGPGIALEAQPRIFERFFREDAARSRELGGAGGGTGLGLAIVKHILIRHGGTVELESSPGRGSRFICRFPLGEKWSG
ncbi:MAG: ATP-binding protein [Oligoflexia bacterium]